MTLKKARVSALKVCVCCLSGDTDDECLGLIVCKVNYGLGASENGKYQ